MPEWRNLLGQREASDNDKRVIEQEDVIIQSVWVPNNRASEFMEPKWQNKRKIDKSKV